MSLHFSFPCWWIRLFDRAPNTSPLPGAYSVTTPRGHTYWLSRGRDEPGGDEGPTEAFHIWYRQGEVGKAVVDRSRFPVVRLEWIWTDECYRRRGIGSTLLREVITTLRAEGASTLEGMLDQDQPSVAAYQRLEAWYQRQGFTLRGPMAVLDLTSTPRDEAGR